MLKVFKKNEEDERKELCMRTKEKQQFKKSLWHDEKKSEREWKETEWTEVFGGFLRETTRLHSLYSVIILFFNVVLLVVSPDSFHAPVVLLYQLSSDMDDLSEWKCLTFLALSLNTWIVIEISFVRCVLISEVCGTLFHWQALSIVCLILGLGEIEPKLKGHHLLLNTIVLRKWVSGIRE